MTGQLGFFTEIEYEPEPVKGLCRCPRCGFEFWEDGVHPAVKVLWKYCDPCGRLEEGSEARIKITVASFRIIQPIQIEPVTIYRRGEIPEELAELYRRTK